MRPAQQRSILRDKRSCPVRICDCKLGCLVEQPRQITVWIKAVFLTGFRPTGCRWRKLRQEFSVTSLFTTTSFESTRAIRAAGRRRSFAECSRRWPHKQAPKFETPLRYAPFRFKFHPIPDFGCFPTALFLTSPVPFPYCCPFPARHLDKTHHMPYNRVKKKGCHQ